LFQYVGRDGTTIARVLAESWVLANARTSWEFREATINILMALADWNGEAASRDGCKAHSSAAAYKRHSATATRRIDSRCDSGDHDN
jgi:hypothetical protein